MTKQGTFPGARPPQPATVVVPPAMMKPGEVKVGQVVSLSAAPAPGPVPAPPLPPPPPPPPPPVSAVTTLPALPPPVLTAGSSMCSTIMAYGASGTTKTTQVLKLIEQIVLKTGRPVRLVSAEPAGFDLVKPYVDAGYVDAFWIHRLMNPRPLLRALGRGEWPVVKNGKIHWLKPGEGENDLTKLSAYVFQGLASMAEQILSHLAVTQSKADVSGAAKGETGLASPGYRETAWGRDDAEVLGSTSQSQYGASQTDLLLLLQDTPSMLAQQSKGAIEYVIFETHEARGQEKASGGVVYGPSLVGSAATDLIPRKVGTLLHFEAVPVTQGQGPAAKSVLEYRAYFRPHPDGQNPMVIWPAKPRHAPDPAVLEALEKEYPGGYIPLTIEGGVDRFVARLEELGGGMAQGLRAKRELAQQKLNGEVKQ